MRRHLTIAVACLAIGALSGVAAYDRAGSGTGGWREIAWPFPRDGWPTGRAFRCDTAMCGDAVEIYVRPKIGFCNCDRGVGDDDEVDRVADLDLIRDRHRGVAPLRFAGGGGAGNERDNGSAARRDGVSRIAGVKALDDCRDGRA